RAEERAEVLSARPRPRKLEPGSALSKAVEEKLMENWSPEQIANRLREEHPDNPAMQVSHETIYKALYIQGLAPFGRNWRSICVRNERSASLGSALSCAAAFPTWWRFPSVLRRPRIEPSLATGKVTSSLVRATNPRLALWSSGRHASSCCCTWRTAERQSTSG